jgi:hypothetical protein
MPTISVRIPEDLRRRMSQIKGVNWSEVVRRAILEKIVIEERIGSKNWDLVRRAGKEADELRMKLEAKYGKCNYDSAETIRCWRDARTWRE